MSTSNGSPATRSRRDDGLFGPDSMVWKVMAHPITIVGGLRALMIEALYPPAMAGVAQHSKYVDDPVGRLRRTSHWFVAVAFGDMATVDEASARVRRIHTRVRGIDPITGRRYSAEDPDNLLWVHTTGWHSFMAAYRAYGGRLTAEQQDRYTAEAARAAEVLGCPRDIVPATIAEQREYFASMLPKLCLSEPARRAIRFVVDPPITKGTLPYVPAMRILASGARSLVPAHLRTLMGIERSRLLDAVTVPALRAAALAMTFPVVREAPRIALPEAYAIGKAAFDAHPDKRPRPWSIPVLA
jgi:uncharacterized protein (DUF2236 family)